MENRVEAPLLVVSSASDDHSPLGDDFPVDFEYSVLEKKDDLMDENEENGDDEEDEVGILFASQIFHLRRLKRRRTMITLPRRRATRRGIFNACPTLSRTVSCTPAP